ncbi:hypothetical protein N0V95_008095 [Ascochyta clinopodiicola]|nr:hypothetical protein N0V95_008095 [Ascochyta clinopodiicola]
MPQHIYTTGDIVRGVVRVDPTARPKNVTILFKGICVLYDKDFAACNTDLFGYEQKLFTSSGNSENYDILRKGTADDGKVELPFQFTFPHVVAQMPPSGRNWHYSKDSLGHPRFQHSPGFLLPPTCTASTNAGVAVAPRVSYYLEARIDSSFRVRQEVKFVPPAPEYDLLLLQPNFDFGTNLPKRQCRYKFIRTRKLLPNYKENGNKLAKVKDFLVEKELFFGLETFSEIPFYRFNVLATPPRVIVIGSDFPILITLQHLDRSSSIPEPPPLFLRRVRVQMVSTYEFFVPQPKHAVNHTNEHIDHVEHTTTLIDRKFASGNGEPIQDGLNLAKFGDVRKLMADESVAPSFSSYGMNLQHVIQVEIWGECVGNEWFGIVCKDKVQFVSGWTFSHVSEEDGAIGLDQPHARPPPQAFPPPEYYTV